MQMEMESIAKILLSTAEDSADSDSGDDDCSIDEKIREICQMQAVDGEVVEKCGSNDVVRRKRKPTRLPDPKIDNRNAILARENRKRKKQELEDLKKVNRRLFKSLKQQVKMNKKLQNERNYYKNLMSKRTDILKFVNVFNTHFPDKLSITDGSTTSRTPPSSTYCRQSRSSRESSSSSCDTACNDNHNCLSSDNGSVTEAGNYDNSIFDNYNLFENIPTEMESLSSAAGGTCEDNWSDFCTDDTLGLGTATFPTTLRLDKQPSVADSLDELLQNIVEEHSYTSSNSPTTLGGGLCIHSTNADISSFCPSCEWNETSFALPTELLQDEDYAYA